VDRGLTCSGSGLHRRDARAEGSVGAAHIKVTDHSWHNAQSVTRSFRSRAPWQIKMKLSVFPTFTVWDEEIPFRKSLPASRFPLLPGNGCSRASARSVAVQMVASLPAVRFPVYTWDEKGGPVFSLWARGDE